MNVLEVNLWPCAQYIRITVFSTTLCISEQAQYLTSQSCEKVDQESCRVLTTSDLMKQFNV